MNKIKFILAFLSLSITSILFAQQQNQYTQYSQNKYLFNPAAAGTEEGTINLNTGYRNQWSGAQDPISGNNASPNSFFLSGYTTINDKFDDLDKNKNKEQDFFNSMPSRGRGNALSDSNFVIKKVEIVEETKEMPGRFAIGGVITNENIDKISRFSTMISAAYHLPLNDQINVSVGAFLGISQFAVNVNELTFKDQNDPYKENGNASKLYPDVGLGGMIYGDKFFAGVSAFQLMQNKLDMVNVPGGSESGKLNVHYYVMGGYNFDLNEDFILTPSTLVRYTGPSPASFDLNAKLTYQQKFWGALGYRNQDAISIMVGVNLIDMLNLSYSYDHVTSDLKTIATSSHEIMVGILLNKREFKGLN